MKYTLSTEFPNKKFGFGDANITRDGKAFFFSGTHLLADMERVRVEEMAAFVLVLSGMEAHGTNKDGSTKYKSQRWFLLEATK